MKKDKVRPRILVVDDDSPDKIKYRVLKDSIEQSVTKISIWCPGACY